MAHAEATVIVNRPVAEVYNFVLDGNNNPRWRPAVIAISRMPGTPDGLGARYKQSLKGPGGRPIDGDYEITQAMPNQSIAFQVIAGPARPTGHYRFESKGDATTVSFTLDLKPQ
jgi:uncharacterized membrane protein